MTQVGDEPWDNVEVRSLLQNTASLGVFWLFVGFGRGKLAFYKNLNASASATFTNVAFYDASKNPGIGARRAVLRRSCRRLCHLVAALSQPPLAHRLNGLITSDQAVSDLRCYFGAGLLDEEVPFTGSRFEHLAGGGDRQAVARVVTADDLIAVQTLSVRIPAQVAVELLEGDLGVRLSELLSSVGFDIDMVEAEAADLAEGSPAHTAWRVLCDQPGIGWVTAGKLLARKRPRLLPVYDQVVRCVLGRPKSFWLDLHGALRADNHALHRELMALRQSADLPATVSALRVCDVVLWMHHRTDHQQRSCIGT